MLEAIRKIIDFSGQEKSRIYRAIALSFFKSLFSMFRMAAIYFVLLAFEKGELSMKPAWTALICLGISILGQFLLKMAADLQAVHAGYYMSAYKRLDIAERLKKVPMGYFNDTSLGHITSVTTNTLEQMADIATRAVMMILQGSLTTVVIATGMLIFDWRIGLIGLCGIAVFLFVNQFTNKSVAKVANEKLAADRDIVGVVLEYIQGISEIRNYHLVEKNNARLDKAIERKTKNDIRAELAAIPAVGVQMLVCKLTGVAICGASLYFYFDGSMAIHNTIIMLLCSYMIFEMLDMAGIYTALLRIIGKGVDLAEEILNIPQMDIAGEKIHPDNLDMHMEHVSFAYENRKIIDDVTLDIKEKTTTAIVGPSGGGKTTITALLSRFWDVDEGKVTLGGRDVRDYSFDSLMENFSFVFQRVYLFQDTIANNIRFGQPDAPMEKVIEAAKKACCHDFIMALPDGYETIVGEGGASLSGGEKQRIAIARAMMKDAPIIILDEATANVDPENERELTNAIENLTSEKTIIMIAHRLKTVRHADQILVVDKGRIVQKGKHEDLMNEEGIYRRFIADREQAVSWKIG